MKYHKKILGERCYLAPLVLEDAGAFAGWLNDEDIYQNLVVGTQVITDHSEREFLANLSQKHVYSIVDLATDELLGNCGLDDIDPLNRTAELGIFIGNKKFWGQGYGADALRALLGYGFRYLNLRNVFLKVYAFNERAQACYKKVGFKEIGRRRRALARNRTEYDVVYMDILSDEWA